MEGKTENDPLNDRLSELSDNEINNLSSKLREESKNNDGVLIGELEPLKNLMDEYDGNGKHFTAKLAWLEANGWTHFRPTARDGDCFYRSFISALLEAFVDHPDRAKLCTQFTTHIKSQWSMFEAMGYQNDILEDFWEPLKELIEKIKDGKVSRDEVIGDLNKVDISPYIVVFLRLLTAAYMEKHSDDFIFFLDENDSKILQEDGQPSIKKYYEHYVQPAYKEADQIAITALTRALSANLRIACLDQTMELEKDGTVAKVQFVPYDTNDDSIIFPTITLLLRPGHYDTIYKSTSKE